MKAMILAAGHGTRMRPLTNHTPKPLLKVGGKPLILWHIENLKKAKFEDIIINIAWLGNKIKKALGDGSRYGVNITYSDEQNDGVLETAGGIKKALPLLGDDPFLVVSGDIWCNYDYTKKISIKGDVLSHIILVNNPQHNTKGDFSISKDSFGKRSVDMKGDTKYTFSGIGYYHPILFKDLPDGKLPLRYVLRKAIHDKKITGKLFTGDWRDIGTPERLTELDDMLKHNN